MKPIKNIRNIFILTVCYLYIILFVYAAVSKLMDFENFRVQLSQSPLLSAFAGFVSYAALIVEIGIAVLLSIPKSRSAGLLAAFSLMTMFTAYIVVILNYSSFVPCSCGGILEKMGWTEHLIFNIIFMILAAIAGILPQVWLPENRGSRMAAKKAAGFLVVGILSVATVVIMYWLSEDIVHTRNNFTRRFPPFPAERIAAYDLKFDSYYFAGQENGKIYLGNTTAPALITLMDTALNVTRKYHINIKDTLQQFRNVRLRVTPPFFYLYDGTVPCIFKGNLEDRNAILLKEKIPGFTKAVVVDSNTFIIRTLSKDHEHLLAKIDLDGRADRKNSPSLLQKQLDGIFDTDGSMQYSAELKKFVYLYYYRNEYIVANDKLELQNRGNTIDTTTKAKLKITYIKNRKQRTFAAPPQLVNRLSTLHRNLLFVNSTLRGKYDSAKMWDNANYIDVYDIVSKSYLFSLYVYKVDGEKIDDLLVTDTHFFVLLGSKIVVYRLNQALKEKFMQ